MYDEWWRLECDLRSSNVRIFTSKGNYRYLTTRNEFTHERWMVILPVIIVFYSFPKSIQQAKHKCMLKYPVLGIGFSVTKIDNG